MSRCFHCGLPAAGNAKFCCAGCEAVASAIAAAGLEAYYETRTAPAARPEPLPQIRVPAGLSQAALVLERVRCAARRFGGTRRALRSPRSSPRCAPWAGMR